MDSTEVKEAFEKINTNIAALATKIQAIETSRASAPERVADTPTIETGHTAASTEDHAASTEDHAVPIDVITAYNAIKAAHGQVKLPASLTIPTDKTGVNKKDHQVLNLLTKCAKFAETGLKIIQSPVSDTSSKLQDILTVLTALVITLQEEHAAIVVQGTFDENVARFFRSLQRTNNFSPEALENLRAAASIASVYRPRRGQSSSGRGAYQGQGQRFGSRGRGRGGRGAWQHQQHQQQDEA